MVSVPVRQQDAVTPQPSFLKQRECLWMLQPRVDEQRICRVAAAQDVAVLIEHRVDDDRQFDQIAQRVGHERQVTRARR